MTDNTVEAIQVHLEDFGWILFPWDDPKNPPGFITDETIFDLNPRTFENKNDGAPAFRYKKNMMRKQWEIV